MEFFGIPVNDEILSNPRPEQVDRLKEGNDIKRSNNFNLSVKSNSRIVWFCFTSLCNWFIKQVPLFLIQPTIFKSKGNRDFVVCVSPGYEQFACSNFSNVFL